MFSYKNKSDNDLVVPNYGEVAAGENLDTPEKIENPNLELQTEPAPERLSGPNTPVVDAPPAAPAIDAPSEPKETN